MSSSDSNGEGAGAFSEPFAFGTINDAIVVSDAPEANAVAPYGSEADSSDMGQKDGDEMTKGGGSPVENGLMHFLSPNERIAKMDEERELRIAKRRQHTNAFSKAFAYVVPYGGIVSSGFNLASSALAAGMISLPYAFNTSGLGMSIIYLVVIAVLTVYSYTLLGIAGQRTGIRNYERITRALLGNYADYLLAILLWILCFGGEISYVIALGTILKAFVVNSESSPEYLKTTSGIRVLTVAVWAVVMLPLCLPKEINSLRYFSVIGVIFIVYFVFCMIAHSARTIHERGGIPNDLVYFRTGNIAIEGLSTFMFAFISQINSFEVYEEMYKPSVKRVTSAASLSVFLSFTLYFCAGLFGYLDFGGAINDSVLVYYNPIKDKWLAVAYVGVMLKVCVAYGMHMIPVRDAIYHFAKVDVKEIAWWKNAVLCASMAGLSLVAGLFIPKISTVFGMIGGLCGGFIGFIFPALLFMYSGDWSLKSVGVFHYIMTYFLLIVGVIGVVFGTGATIYSVAS